MYSFQNYSPPLQTKKTNLINEKFIPTVKSDTKTNEPKNPPAIVNGALDAICVRNTCIDANNKRATRSEKRNDDAWEAPKRNHLEFSIQFI